MENKFEQQLSQLDIRLTERQKEQFHQYYELLVEWNKVMNLTGITEYDEVNEYLTYPFSFQQHIQSII